MIEIKHISTGATGGTSLNAAIPSVSTLITLPALSTQVTVVNYSTATLLYVNFFGPTCTTGNFYLAPGASYTYDSDGITQISILGSATPSGNYGVNAH